MTTAARCEVGVPEGVAEIDVVASDRADDIDDALAIIHDGFVEAGYMHPTPSGRRMHPSYLNPGTLFLIATMGGRPVGTCALVADGPFGLPSDRAFVEENDALRERVDSPLREGGSLAIRSDARRHTRRIMLRLTAAISRILIEERPHGRVVIAISPESQRFYESALGAGAVTTPRPYFGAPAVLLSTSGAEIAAHCGLGSSVLGRTMNGLLLERQPTWLSDRRVHDPLPSARLAELLDEQPFTRSLCEQVRLIAATRPEAFAENLPESLLRVVA